MFNLCTHSILSVFTFTSGAPRSCISGGTMLSESEINDIVLSLLHIVQPKIPNLLKVTDIFLNTPLVGHNLFGGR